MSQMYSNPSPMDAQRLAQGQPVAPLHPAGSVHPQPPANAAQPAAPRSSGVPMAPVNSPMPAPMASPLPASMPGAAPRQVPPAPSASPDAPASPVQPAAGGTLSCPECGAPVAPVSKDGVILFYGCTAYRQTGCRGMWSADPDSGKPFTKTCPECGKPLVKRRAKKGGRVYVACFNAQGHASGEAAFFDADGAPEAPRPRPKGSFACPECGGPLKYFKLKKGRSAGAMCFACFETSKHASCGPRFFDDADGVPAFEKTAAAGRQS